MSPKSAARAQLRALEAQFYRQFSMPGEESDARERASDDTSETHSDDDRPSPAHHSDARTADADDASEEASDDDEEEEDDDEDDDDDDDEDDDNEDDEYGEEGEEDANDDELDDGEDLLQSAMTQPSAPSTSVPSRRRPVETVVFSESRGAPSGASVPASARRNFMVSVCLMQSSKIEKINAQETAPPDAGPDDDEEGEEDQRANDRKLAELLSTSLFAPGTSTHKRKLNTTTNETLARVMELSTSDTLHPHAAGSGWGEKQLRAQELGKMPARIRSGLRRAAGERRERDIELQKELGLWNPRYQNHAQLSRGSATERGSRPTEPKKRMRGIGSGIGSFRNGTLHLSEADVRRIQGPPRGQARRRGKKK
ncbi:hypothetical protein MBRA1_002499 [Malassezia brasiliensis]|uniref:Protein FAF1 n=1 Tax=Malassezia brasiliensis TaxID=1821822 RepID=A0AAF0DYF5_9BASI|nr:hypothetical protein MBRA1_002499 [Malassezia brasiliensis]